MSLDTREFATSLRHLPKSELERYCKGCGMDDREFYATMDYVYYRIKSDAICERLGMSRSTFERHKKVLSIRLEKYLYEQGLYDKINSL